MKKTQNQTELRRIIRQIKLLETDEKTRTEKCFDDPAIIALSLRDAYACLGELYLKEADIKQAINAFKKAKENDLKFIKSEFSYDPEYLKKQIKSTQAYWNEKINKLTQKEVLHPHQHRRKNHSKQPKKAS